MRLAALAAALLCAVVAQAETVIKVGPLKDDAPAYVVEFARVCEKAAAQVAAESIAKAKQLRQEAAAAGRGGDRKKAGELRQEVKRLQDLAAECGQKGMGVVPRLASYVEVGSIGEPDVVSAEVGQIVDAQKMLVYPYSMPFHGGRAQKASNPCMLVGVPTAGLSDGRSFEVFGGRIIRVAGTEQYEAVSGAMKTVPRLEVFEFAPFLAE